MEDEVERGQPNGSSVTFRVLGGIEVWHGDVRARLRGSRHRAVLARLLVARGEVVPVDRLIDDLWADEPPPQALAVVQTFVSQLRRVLEPDRAPRAPSRLLVTDPPGYALRADAEGVDAWRFERLVRDAGAVDGDDEPAATRARLGAALALWRGPAFGEFAEQPWAQAEAARIEELRCLAIERRAEAELRLGGAADVVGGLEVHLAEHPLREQAWRLLSVAHYAAGRQGDALATLRRARRVLRDELDVDPGPELQRLETEILAQADDVGGLSAVPRHGALPAASVPSRTDVFVGREAELAALCVAAGEAVAGHGGLVLISGEAGTGKSTLVEWGIGALAARGWKAAQGRCPQVAGAPPGWPWAELLGELAAAAPPPPELADVLARLLADGAGPVAADPTVTRFLLHRAVGTYLIGVAGRQPLLLVLDDVHHADGETLALLTQLVPQLAGHPVLVVATLREGEDAARLAEPLAVLARQLPLRLRLGGLDPAAVGQLVRATCTVTVDDDVVAAVAERTGGNPFFVRETARLLEVEGPAAAATVVPAGVQDVLRRRIARLPGTARTVLRHAALIGRRIDVEVLAELAGQDEDTFLDAVDAALLTGLLVEPEAGRLEFAHALVRDVLYADVSRLRRARLHGRVATVLERRRPTEVAALARHFDAAGTAETAAAASRYASLAAEDAERRLAYREAAALWRQSVAAWDRIPPEPLKDPRERLELVLRRVQAHAHSGDLVAARALRADAVQQARDVDDAELTARVVVSFDVPTLWVNRRFRTESTEIVELAEQTVARLPPGDSTLRCRLLVTLALELEAGRAPAREAEAMARRLGDPETLVLALNGMFMQSYWIGGLPERERVGREMLAVAQRHNLIAAELVAHMILMQVHVMRGEFDIADAHVAATEEVATRDDRPLMLALTAFYQGLRHVVADRPAEAESAYREAVRRLGQVGRWDGERGLAEFIAVSLRMLEGRFTDVVEQLGGQGDRIAAVFPDHYPLALALAGRVEQARAVAGAPKPIRRDYFFETGMATRGRLGIVLGEQRRAREAYDALAPFADLVVGAAGTVALEPVAQVLGDLALFFDRPADAAAYYRQAAAVAERAGVPRWAARAAEALSCLEDGTALHSIQGPCADHSQRADRPSS